MNHTMCVYVCDYIIKKSVNVNTRTLEIMFKRVNISIHKSTGIEGIRIHGEVSLFLIYMRTHRNAWTAHREAGAGFENKIYSPNVARVCGMKKYFSASLRARGETR